MFDLAKSSLGVTWCGNREFRWGERTYVMGILNITPDSFSGDGLGDNVDLAVAQAWRFVGEGADMLDIGGKSTRPGHAPISAAEELRRVLPVMEKLAGQIPVPLSIDTYKADVARQALDAGAAMINDIWGLKRDPQLAELAAERGVPLILMHNQEHTEYHDLISDVLASLSRSLELAVRCGVKWENLLIDPGIGFGKTLEHNLEIMRHLNQFKSLGRPILLGTSRKSMIGRILALPPEQRVEGTSATIALGIAQGVDIVRVHDVRAMVRVCRMTDAIVRGWQPEAKPTFAYLGLHSNVGHRRGNIMRALELLRERVKVERVSSVYEAETMGYEGQSGVLNAVCRISTTLRPGELLNSVKEVERRLSGEGNRFIEVDILFYGDQNIRSAELIVPHPHLAERASVLIPLAEIAPELVHLETGATIGELASKVVRREKVRLYEL